MADDDSFQNGVNILNDEEDDQIQMSSSKPGKRGVKKKGLLKDDIHKMMVGFGECEEPRDDTMELMELYVIEFITNISKRAQQRSQRGGFTNIQLRDLLKVIEDDEKKFLRVPYLLTGIQSMDIKQIQREMDPTIGNNANKGLLNA
ncbi:UNKNOWN [Stylonychia lemnae]|uniref:Transcription initiation factor TFIID subunit 13 n=1 Tax=Stylonychia lemnae TaxID=5949 RepID=A0A078B3A4_STYLE|nr:UNKNOWN [Stylonychia lemnae]|eukprot:CDW87722.1 UNKNOWN [Stylonychia lemnae]